MHKSPRPINTYHHGRWMTVPLPSKKRKPSLIARGVAIVDRIFAPRPKKNKIIPSGIPRRRLNSY